MPGRLRPGRGLALQLVNGTNVPAIQYLFRDTFSTDRAAGAVNGTAAEPGPGNRNTVDAENKLSISGGKLVISNGKISPVWGDPQLYGLSQIRAVGRAVMLDAQNVGSGLSRIMFGWDADVTGSLDHGHGIFWNENTLTVTENNVSTVTGITLTSNTVYSIAVVERSSGAFYFIKGGSLTNWTLLWIGSALNTTPMYPILILNYTSGATFSADDLRVRDLGGVFADDYGIASQRLAGARSEEDAFGHTADCLIGWTVTTRVAGQQVYFRAQDAQNYWRVDVAADGSIALQEVVAGTLTSRGTGTAGSIANGQRMVVIADGQTIRVYANNVLKITHASAANFATATAGKLLALGSGGAISDIVSWPRSFGGGAFPAASSNF